MNRKDPQATEGRSDSAARIVDGCPMRRRDFLNVTLSGYGAAVLGPALALGGCSQAGPVQTAEELAFNGPPGAGDYAQSNGNTFQVVTQAHNVRDDVYGNTISQAPDDGGRYDLIVVGGGPAGLAAAYYYTKNKGAGARVLILDNHPVFGGEAKQNEFDVNGVRLIAPQGSNVLFTPYEEGDQFLYEEFADLGIPLEFEYVQETGTSRKLDFDVSNFMFLWEAFKSDSIGMFVDDDALGRGRRWVTNAWERRLEGTGIADPLRSELLRWRYGLKSSRPDGEETDRWLDTMTYREYLVNEQKLPVEVADFTEPYLASAVGFGSSVVSAYIAIKKVGLPGGFGVQGVKTAQRLADILKIKPTPNCFPGGNSAIARAFLKRLVPSGIQGNNTFDEIVTRPIAFDNLDRPGNPVRVRLSSQVVDVHHTEAPGQGVRVVYAKDGRLHAAHASAVVMASGGWINKHVVSDLPDAHRAAYDNFQYAPMIVANVALTNWRFLDRLGITAATYTGGEFGFSCNIRRPMKLSGYAPPLDPSQPAVLTFYAPPLRIGMDAAQQGAHLRTELLETPFHELETRVLKQMTHLFGDAGFSASRDVAGIVINRWGHAYVVPTPGFSFGVNGNPAPSEVIRQNHGRIAFASAELRGLQNYRGAVYESKRAIEQLAEYL